MISKDKQFSCECGKKYAHIQSFNRHTKRCEYHEELLHDQCDQCEDMRQTIYSLEKEVAKMSTKIEFLEKMNAKSEKQCDRLTKELEKYSTVFITQLINTKAQTVSQQQTIPTNNRVKSANTGGRQNTINNIKNIFNNAPIICVNDASHLEAILRKMNHIDIFANWEQSGQVAQKISDMIVGKYKTDSLEKRSLWATDVSRLNYLIRELVNKKPQWNADKGAIKVSKYIIDPVLELLKKNLKKWRSDFAKMDPDDQFNDVLLEPLNNIIASIEKGSLKKEILKLISPHFSANQIDSNQTDTYDENDVDDFEG